MELNLAIGHVSPEIFQDIPVSHHSSKITVIEDELKFLVQDSSNLAEYVKIAIQNIGNLTKLWENLDYSGKVRLQKLVYPDGMVYDPETHAVRTLSLNPIFSAITSISQFLASRSESGKVLETEKFHSVYLMFGSSNFFWKNLEKIAILCKDHKHQPLKIHSPCVSITCQTPVFNSTDSTDAKQAIPEMYCKSYNKELFSGTTATQQKVKRS